MTAYRLRTALRFTLLGIIASAAPGVFAAGPAATGLIAEADSAETAFSNPAGMSRLEGSHTTLQGTVVAILSTFEVDEDLATHEGGDPEKDSSPLIIPTAYYVRQLNDKWHAGISLTAPAGFGSDYGGTWAGRYYIDDFSLVYVAVTPAVSWRITDKFSVGAGIGANYTAQTSTTKANLFGDDDGKVTADLDGIGINFTLSMLYEFTNQTRAGISYTSKSEADLEGKVKLRNLPEALDATLSAQGLTNVDTKVTNTLPQRALVGVYHELDSGVSFTVDALWMKFSDFSTTDLEFNGETTNVSTPDIYDDVWAGSVGASYPWNERLTYRVGAMYMSQPVDDEDRGLSLRLDSIWAVGAGLSYDFDAGRSVDASLNFANVGEAPVDTGDSLRRGRVVGENETPYAIAFSLGYNF